MTTKPRGLEIGIEVLDQPLVAHGNIATAGGCMSSQYLDIWYSVQVINRLVGRDAAESAIHYVAPVGEKDETIRRSLSVMERYVREIA